jgi:RimJ/RimL family protein N-acetyltransferase
MNTELVPFSRSDFKALISWVRNPDELFIWSADAFTFPLDEIQLERHYQDAQGPRSSRMLFTALDGQTRQPVGHIGLIRIDRAARKASLAFVLVDPGKRGRGYGKGIVQAILQEGFSNLKLAKMDLFVFDYNTTAISCYQKLGFETEKVVDDLIKRDEEFKRLYLMGLSLEKWLAGN